MYITIRLVDHQSSSGVNFQANVTKTEQNEAPIMTCCFVSVRTFEPGMTKLTRDLALRFS